MAALNRIYSPRQDRRFMAEVQDEVDAVMSERVNFTSKQGSAPAASWGSAVTPNRVRAYAPEEQPIDSLSREQTQR